MNWILSLHIIAFVSWFAGLFYLPRLFVYHATCTDTIGHERFKCMEKKLFFYIMNPAAFFVLISGVWLLSFNYDAYSHMTWLHIKLILVAFLAVFHLYLWKILWNFKQEKNKHSHVYYRWLNEIPTLSLVAIVILAKVKPF